MKRVRWLRFALDVARRADLQRDAAVPYPLPERGRIIEMMSVSDPFCAEIKRVLYGIRSLGISRVAREGDVQFPCQIEHRVEAAQRHDAFSPCQVTPDHAFSEELLRQAHGLEIFGHVQRFLADAHGTKQDPRLQRGMLLQPGLLPCQYSLHGVTLCKPVAQMELRCKADLGQAVALPCQHVDQAFRHQREVFFLLQQLQRQFKPLQVFVDAAAVRRDLQPCPELLQSGGGKLRMLLFGQFPHGLRRDGAVQMQMQFRLGKRISDIRHLIHSPSERDTLS